MPYKNIGDLPDSFKNKSPEVKRKGLSILNGILKDNPDMDHGEAIAIALKKAQEEVKEHSSYVIQMEKNDKKVNYRKPPLEEKAVCGDCRFYEYGSCSLVEGHIEPSYTCDLFEDLLPSQLPVPTSEISEPMMMTTEEKRSKGSQEVTMKERSRKGDVSPGQLVLNATLLEEVGDTGKVWEVRCIAPGLSLNKTYYSESVLKESVDMFSGVPCFADHGPGGRSVRDVVGWFENPRYVDGDGIIAEFHAMESTPWFLGPFKEAYDRGKRDLIGFSINGEGNRRLDRIENQSAYVIDRIRRIESVDGVIAPSAGGKVVKLVASKSEREEDELVAFEELTLEELAKVRPDLVEQIRGDDKASREKAIQEAREQARKEAEEELKALEEAAKAKQLKEDEERKADEERSKLNEQERSTKERDAEIARIAEVRQKADEELKAIQEERQKLTCSNMLREALSASDIGLPTTLKQKLERRFHNTIFTQEELDAAIKDEQDTYKALQDERPSSFPRIQMGESEKDKAIKALDGLLRGESVDGIPPARTIKEAYSMVTGRGFSEYVDAHQILRESWSPSLVEDSGRIREEIQVSSWAEILSDRIHKRMLEIYRLPYLDDWRKVVSSVIGVPDFKTQRRQLLGGYSNFSSVAEGVAYATVTSPTDIEATYTLTKYGGLEKLTLEAIANDDVGAVRRIPELLARACKQVVYENVFDHFRKNANVSWAAVSLFNSTQAGASHQNVIATGTTAQALGDATFAAAKRLLVEQTERDSAKPLGLRAKYLLVPPELEPIAIRLHQNEYAVSATGSQGETAGSVTSRERDVNIHRNSFESIVVPYWTSNSRWFALADPQSVPTIEVGFYQGRQEPELFTQDMPNVGSMFDRDQLTYKARIIFGSAVLDHRGFIASNEATEA